MNVFRAGTRDRQGRHPECKIQEDAHSRLRQVQGWHPRANAAAAKSLQSCPTLCDPIDGSPSGSPVLGILKAITLEWVAISFSDA